MKLKCWALFLICASGGALAQSPFVFNRGVLNAASYMPTGLPGGGIARGSIFVIFGSNIGPASGVQASSFPLGTTLAAVSISVVQGSNSVSAIPVYAGPNQINAIMPSNAPLGMASLRITYNGIRSNPVPVRIVNAAFGIFSANSAGTGPGILQNFIDPGNQPINAPLITAAPGQAITLWGTGLGPVMGPDNVAPTVGSLSTPVEIFVGGKLAKMLYSGRSPCCSGVDQIVFLVPDDAPLGCWTPVSVRTGGVTMSNFVTMAIQGEAAACADSQNAISPVIVNGGKTGVFLSLKASTLQDVGTRAPINLVSEYSAALFANIQATRFPFNPVASLPPPGACTVYTAAGDLLNGDPVAGIVTPGQLLSAGSFRLTGPNGALSLSSLLPSVLVSYLGGAASSLGLRDSTILAPGSYSLTGTAGRDVGALQSDFTMAPNVAWTNRDQLTTLDRSQGFTVNWTGAAPDQVVIVAGAGVDLPTNSSALFACVAPKGSSTFTVPPAVLANVPASRLIPLQSKSVVYLLAAPLGNPAVLSAPGLEAGFALHTYVNGKTVRFQ